MYQDDNLVVTKYTFHHLSTNMCSIRKNSGSPLHSPADTIMSLTYWVPYKCTSLARDTSSSFGYFFSSTVLSFSSKDDIFTLSTLPTCNFGLNNCCVSRRYAMSCWCLVERVSSTFLKQWASLIACLKKLCLDSNLNVHRSTNGPKHRVRCT